MRQVRLVAETRAQSGSAASRALRRDGKVPAVVYGFGEPSLAVQLNLRDLQNMLKSHAEHALVDLVVGDTSENVVMREMQRDTVRRQLLHVDFQRVRLDEEISVDVEVVLDGTPVGVREGGVLEFFTRTLHVRTLPTNLPDAIHVDVSGLGLNEAIHVRDLPFAEGLTVMNDEDTVVVTVATPHVEAERSTDEAATEPALVERRDSADED